MTRFGEYRRFLLGLDERISRQRSPRRHADEQANVDDGESAMPSAACDALQQSARRNLAHLANLPAVEFPAALESDAFLEGVYARALERAERRMSPALEAALRNVPMPGHVDVDGMVVLDDADARREERLRPSLAHPLRMSAEASDAMLASLRRELSDPARFAGAETISVPRRRMRWAVAAALFIGLVGSGVFSELFTIGGTPGPGVDVEFRDVDRPLDESMSPSHLVRILGR